MEQQELQPGRTLSGDGGRKREDRDKGSGGVRISYLYEAGTGDGRIISTSAFASPYRLAKSNTKIHRLYMPQNIYTKSSKNAKYLDFLTNACLK